MQIDPRSSWSPETVAIRPHLRQLATEQGKTPDQFLAGLADTWKSTTLSARQLDDMRMQTYSLAQIAQPKEEDRKYVEDALKKGGLVQAEVIGKIVGGLTFGAYLMAHPDSLDSMMAG